MQIINKGIISQAEANTPRATLTFPSVIALSNGTLLATCRAGLSKDTADGSIEFFRSSDNGDTWREDAHRFDPVEINGLLGSLRVCYLTELTPGHLIAACLWVDRTTYPNQPLFNEATEGCLPMAIVLADSHDFGATWTAWRVVPVPDEIGPPSLTNPILKLSDGRLALSVETNKSYQDSSQWYQRAVFFHSNNLGQTWTTPITVAQDPSGRLFNWDLRVAVAPSGQVGSFAWTYDRETDKYRNIHRRLSHDDGETWTTAEDLGFTDQAARPAIFPDSHVVLAWVDRFNTQSIRARLAPSLDAPFDPESEVVVYQHQVNGEPGTVTANTGEHLALMGLWTFGLPFCEALPKGEVLVVYYAGTNAAMDFCWAKISLT